MTNASIPIPQRYDLAQQRVPPHWPAWLWRIEPNAAGDTHWIWWTEPPVFDRFYSHWLPGNLPKEVVYAIGVGALSAPPTLDLAGNPL